MVNFDTGIIRRIMGKTEEGDFFRQQDLLESDDCVTIHLPNIPDGSLQLRSFLKAPVAHWEGAPRYSASCRTHNKTLVDSNIARLFQDVLGEAVLHIISSQDVGIECKVLITEYHPRSFSPPLGGWQDGH